MSLKHTKLFWQLAPALAVALASAAVAGTAESEDAADDDSIDPMIEVVIVTAEKRQEDILKVPLTMSAFNDRMIKELGMTNSKDIEQLVPGLQFGNDNVRWGQGTAIRGIGSRNWGEVHSDMAVATYVDGVYSRSAISVAPNLFDVERLEVGRGPQGTLNGRKFHCGLGQLHHQTTDGRVGRGRSRGVHRPVYPALQHRTRRSPFGAPQFPHHGWLP